MGRQKDRRFQGTGSGIFVICSFGQGFFQMQRTIARTQNDYHLRMHQNKGPTDEGEIDS
jgi:hypothetical protein